MYSNTNVYNDRTNDMLYNNIVNVKENKDNTRAILFIGIYASSYGYDVKPKQYNYIKNYIQEIGDNLYLYNGFISFHILSECFPKSKFIYNITHNSEQYNRCHHNSIIMSKFLPNSKILTGFINYQGQSILHSVILYNDNIFDTNLNIVLKKKDYYKLTNFKLLNSLTRKKYQEISPYLVNTLFQDKDVLLYNKEILNDIKRNKKMWEEYRNFK